MGQYKRKLSKGVRWFFSGQYLGKKYFSKAIYHTKKECAKAERIKLEELDRQARNPTVDYNIKEIALMRLDEVQVKNSRKYYEENRRFLKMLLNAVGHEINVSQVTKADINKLLVNFSKQLQKEGKDNWKVNSCIRALKSFFNYCINVGGVDMVNPVVGIRKFPVRIKLKYIPPEDEVKKVFEICTPTQRELLQFIEESGCRVMEAVRLKFSDIDENTVTLYTRKSKNSNLTPRTIPKPKCLNGVVGKGKVFKEWNQYPRFLENKIRKLKFNKWSYHNLRHRRASIWANSGMSLVEIQYRLGHSNIEVTQGYLQLLRKDFR